MNKINIEGIKKQGIYFETVDMEKLNAAIELNFSKFHALTDKGRRKRLMEKKEEIEGKIRSILFNSEENIKSTVPIINNVNKQLMQDNLLLKMKLESMKQTSKNIINYCLELQKEAKEQENNELNQVLNAILEKAKGETLKLKEGE